MVAKMKHDMKAILGEDFFKDEVKCDYHIPSYMKMKMKSGDSCREQQCCSPCLSLCSSCLQARLRC